MRRGSSLKIETTVFPGENKVIYKWRNHKFELTLTKEELEVLKKHWEREGARYQRI